MVKKKIESVAVLDKEETAVTVIQQPEIVADGRMVSPEQMKHWYNDFVKFSQSILREGLDYGIIPGCQKPSLYKPGAEKLMVAYGMSVEVLCTKEIVDFDRKFISFTYRAIVRKNERSWQCEGSCNSFEKKYQIKKKEWNKDTKSYDISYTPSLNPFEFMNTLQKMAQKRAIVGAVLLATGASEFFTQDIEDLKIFDIDYEIAEDKEKSNKDYSSNVVDIAPDKAKIVSDKITLSDNEQKAIDGLKKIADSPGGKEIISTALEALKKEAVHPSVKPDAKWKKLKNIPSYISRDMEAVKATVPPEQGINELIGIRDKFVKGCKENFYTYEEQQLIQLYAFHYDRLTIGEPPNNAPEKSTIETVLSDVKKPDKLTPDELDKMIEINP